MAKIVIGNVKGKDGRGIAKIVKTASTGAVDTYTITYTDNTTSTFTIKNSDTISLQRQIVPSAAVESSATASQAYAAGDYVVVNGILRKVKSAIAKGNAIGDSNSTAKTVTGELATLGDSVSQDILHRPTCTLTATVTGWHGEAFVTTNQFNDETNRWEYDRGSFLQLRVWLWSYKLSEDPWTNAVQPPNNPFGTDAWCAKVPIKVTDGSFEEVVRDVAVLTVADSSGYVTFNGVSKCDMFLARDGYPYVLIGEKDKFANAAGFVHIDTTVFNSRFKSEA